ncbi:OmpA family protein [Cytophagaceae bacterium YF14B1]|uniref:OmpA family protein n=1 Tax=Xanthocytophaga flava TaxID=3048013 RepID=A0AAE3QLL2_9BACT|nr:OmpA family protein [Xanthocytophaga flavus]MDJ1481185.1 OmpA family protein [Xanthocytophaga flavus]
MKKFYTYLLWIGLSLASGHLIAQSADADLVAEGDAAYNIGGKMLALETYELALKANPNNVRANFMAGKCILETIDKGRASKYLQKAYELDPKVSKDILFLIAESYHLGFKFDEAIDYYQKYTTELKAGGLKTTEAKNSLAKTEKRVKECENARKFTAEPNAYQSTNAGDGVNSIHPEYGVAVNKDETMMVFTSRRDGSTGIGNVDTDLQFYEDIYISYFKDGKWQPAKNIGSPINTEYHDASIGLSPDGKTLYLYKDENGGDIYVSEMNEDSTWTDPHPIDQQVNSKYNENSISISADGLTMFFTSDRPGGLGGIDIWMCKKDKRGRWGKPENMGAPVNTPNNEDGPFIDYDGKTLYFSSNAHEGMGGYDVFVSEFDSASKKWKEPVNIGYPISTPDNDIYFVKSGDSKYGYYASVKDDGMGEKDIYKVLLPEDRRTYEQLKNKPIKKDTNQVVKDISKDVPIEAKEMQVVKLQIRVLADGKKSLDVGSIIVKGKNDGVVVGIKKVANGIYQCTFQNSSPQDYIVSVEQNGYMFENLEVTVPAMSEIEQLVRRDVKLQKLKVGFVTVLHNIYFDFNKTSFKIDSYKELNKLARLLKENPSYRVEIAGHTDNVGSNDYNQQLSHRRAVAVVNYLISRRVDASRLVAQGYGETQPMASNDDEREGREFNRRTEFKIISEGKSNLTTSPTNTTNTEF